MLYFGCWQQAGHYLFGPHFTSRRMDDCPVGNFIDGGLAPINTTEQGVAELTYIHGWTILSFWDRSQDTRHGCNSSFLWIGQHSFDDMILKAKEEFPELFQRFKFEIKLNVR